ncbi:energy transducer TonB [Methylomonas rivi]|uniref:Energy transducer TonB n=1 Tax=Methylomonas rivi TaxID=2952226 RepID=A0ABT1UBM6_9GAMM|nr:energy transducer TonB [Methylomonas sp. WSC-6]MCQ8130491.1 energy transducer TonB [Methylomonas sp. WSC-6]
MDFFQTSTREVLALYKTGNSFVDSSAASAGQKRFARITPARRNDNSLNLTVLGFIVLTVSGLHAFGFKCFFYPEQAKPPRPEPIVTKVSMLTVPAAKPELATPPPPKTASKPPLKKKQPKPKLKKISPQMPPSSFSPDDQVFDLQPLENSTVPDFSNPLPVKDTQAEAQPYTEAYFNAEYDKNPKPDYPSMARSRGWQGKVVLRVEIGEAGEVESVAVEQSSGHALLDESALAAVRDWLFVPAMRANHPIASSVLVPIIFSLRDEESAD